jgi:hypothetical protein
VSVEERSEAGRYMRRVILAPFYVSDIGTAMR